MKKIISTLLAGAMLVSAAVMPALAEGRDEFPDARHHWARRSIERWAEAGLLKGDQNGNVTPTADMTRAQYATLLMRLLGLEDDPTQTFNDLTDPDAWYASAVRACKAAGIMTGDQSGNCNPHTSISRAEAMVMFVRAMGLKNQSDVEALMKSFSDSANVPSWAAESLAAMLEKGILAGVGYDNDEVRLDATENINRGSVFTLLDKAIGLYITEAGDYTARDGDRFVVINVPADENGKVGAVNLSGAAACVLVAQGTAAAVNLSVSAETVKVEAPVSLTLEDGAAVETLTLNEKTEVTLNAGAAVDEAQVNAESDLTLEKDAAVGEMTLNAAGNVSVAKGAAVTAMTLNAAGTVNNKGTVGTLNANVSGVTFNGTRPKKTVTADDVKAPTSSGSTSSGGGGGGGGSSSVTRYLYTVSGGSFTGGTVTADVTATNTPDQTVTLTVTPATKNGLPYVLSAAPTVTCSGQDVAVSPAADGTYTFVMTTEGSYKISASFVQPITDAALFVVQDEATYKKLESYGYSSKNREHELLAVQTNPWLAFCVKKGEGYADKKQVRYTLTTDEGVVTKWATNHDNKFGRWQTSAIGSLPDQDELGLNGDVLNFHLTFDYEGASYAFVFTYVKSGVTAKTFTVKGFNGEVLQTGSGAVGQAVTIRSAPAVVGHHFTGWDKTVTDGKYTVLDGDNTITAQYAPNSITMTFSGVEGMADATYTYTGSEALPQAPTKASYTFDGWSVDGKLYPTLTRADIKAIIAAKADGASVTATAQWTFIPTAYTVTFDLDGGVGAAENVTFSTTESGFTAVENWPADPTRKCYTFVGWFLGEETDPVTKDTVTTLVGKANGKTISLKAKWTENALTGSVTLSGDAQWGGTLTASYDNPKNVDEKNFGFVWYCDGAEIPEATESTYVTDYEQVGKTITAAVVGKEDYTGSVTSNGITVEKRVLDGTVTIKPVTEGDITVGTELKATYAGTVSRFYKCVWYREGQEKEIDTTAQHTVVAADQGKTLKVVVQTVNEDKCLNPETEISDTIFIPAASTPDEGGES